MRLCVVKKAPLRTGSRIRRGLFPYVQRRIPPVAAVGGLLPGAAEENAPEGAVPGKQKRPEMFPFQAFFGPSDEIRTHGPLNPIQVLYQTELHPDVRNLFVTVNYYIPKDSVCQEAQALFFTFIFCMLRLACIPAFSLRRCGRRVGSPRPARSATGSRSARSSRRHAPRYPGAARGSPLPPSGARRSAY